jgi:hypothetical protein
VAGGLPRSASTTNGQLDATIVVRSLPETRSPIYEAMSSSPQVTGATKSNPAILQARVSCTQSTGRAARSVSVPMIAT